MIPFLADVAPPDIVHHLGATQIQLVPTVLVVVVGLLYLWGVRRLGALGPGQHWSSRRTLAFMSGLVVTFVAIESVIGVYDDVLFYDHMVQHLLLIMIAAPLFAMGAPLELLTRATSGTTHAVVTRAMGSKVAEVIGHPITGFALYAALIPLAHLTSFYNFTITHEAAHDNEHLLFLAVGYLFWRPVVGIEPSRHPLQPGLRLVYLMLAVPVDTFSGLALTFTNHEIFPAYLTLQRAWGPTLVHDLHIGGSIMWAAGDTLMVLAMIPVCVQWVRYEEERTRRLDAELDAAEARAALEDRGASGAARADVTSDSGPGPMRR
jgi:putative copper resistance protein D